MKRALTILILLVFLLNAVGFYGVFLGLQFKYAQEANETFDDNQNPIIGAVTFKIPLTLPYAVDSRDFERVRGEFENQGDVYRLVKQKLSRDTLFIVCIKDAKSKKINQALTDYVKTFTDQPINSKQQSKLIQSLIKDYLLTGTIIESQSSGWVSLITHSYPNEDNISFLRNKIKYPPKSFSLI